MLNASVATELTVDALKAVVSPGYSIRSEKPITLAVSEPKPSVAVVIGNVRQYADRHPTAADIALLVEVADTTLTRDRQIKKTIYAAAGISC